MSSRSIPGSWPPPAPKARSPISMATPASSCTAAIRWSSSRRNRASSKSPICSSTAACRPKPSSTRSIDSIMRHTMVNEQLLRFFQGFHHDAHPMAMVSAVVASMAAFYHDTTDINDPRHREIFAHRIIAKLPDHRCGSLQAYAGSAVHLSAQRSAVLLEHAQHVLRGAVRTLRDRSCRRRGAGSAVHPACRPRTERQHLDRAPGRKHRGQSVCGHLSGRVGAVGSCARRSQRGGARHAGRHRLGREHRQIPRAGQRQVRQRAA